MANTIEVHVDVLVENGNESSEILIELQKKIVRTKNKIIFLQGLKTKKH